MIDHKILQMLPLSIHSEILKFINSEEGAIRRNYCFHNAKKVAKAIPKLSYVEGMVTVKGLEEPVHHAWNQYLGKNFDLTSAVGRFEIETFREKLKIPHSRLKRMSTSGLYNPYKPELQWHELN